MKKNTQHNQQGYVILITILIIGAVSATIAISLLLLSIQASKNARVKELSIIARVYADTCAESALQEIRDSTPFTGTQTLTFSEGECTYTVTSGGGQNRTVMASSTVDTIIRRVEVSIDKINPQINIISWQEVSSF
ncbi:hypothetical protein GW765_04210 [Candidatus Parcubacteria bacterium]|uniref:Type II secretion system protein n=1 Tax=Candidatus Magasanikbacteria bacterium CG10_big_fil_rev_8_21_14_0_10_38_6 TaxID=1974647 RepID=A0A2M6NZU5_9BACT|nr:hypothetical protein [Candidatus Parcubacteria bacterium]PIR76961.1 MAG: hypothetical protein COU30_05030 [Candidatus Magasanikbacteria bacterium CG10_big_fil_rev_8_21_14_0_10_38_6]